MLRISINRHNILPPAGDLLDIEVEKAGYENLEAFGFHADCKKLGFDSEDKLRLRDAGEERERLLLEATREKARIDSIFNV